MTPLRALVLTFLILALLASMAVWGFRFAMEHAPEYRKPLIERLEAELHTQVDVGYLELGWEGFGPAIEMHDLRMQGLGDEPLQASMLRVGVSVWDLIRGKIIPRRITLEGLLLTLIQRDGKWKLESMPERDGAAGGTNPLDALTPLSRVRIRDSELQLELEHATVAMAPLKIDQIQLLRRFGRQVVLGTLHDEHDARIEAEIEMQNNRPESVRFSLSNIALQNYRALDPRLDHLGDVRLQRFYGDAKRDESNPAERWNYAAHVDAQQHARDADGVPVSLLVKGPLQGYVGADGVRVNSPRLDVSTGSSVWPQQNLWVEYSPAPSGNLRLQAGWLVLQDIWPFVRPWLPATSTVTEINGVLSDITLDWLLPDGRPSVLAQMSGMGVTLSKPQVQLRGVDGEISSSGNRGRVMLNSRDVWVDWPDVLAEPTVINSLGGTMEWALGDGGLQFEVPDLAYAVAGVDGVGRVSGEADNAWHTELRFLAPDVRQARSLIPMIWPESLREWLGQAAQAGELAEGRVRLDGMAGKVRHTEVDLSLREVQFRFAPGWTDVNADTGALQIRDHMLTVQVPKGRLGELNATDVSASIHLKSDEPLRINAHVSGRAEDVMRVLAESPVEPHIRELNKALKVRGAVSGTLDLAVDLKDGHQTRWQTEADLNKVRVDIAGWPSPVKNAQGHVRISAEGLDADKLTGQMNGWPLEIQSSGNAGRSILRGTTTALVDKIPETWPIPLWLQSRMSGSADLTVEARVGGQEPVEVIVRSDLMKAAVALPPPLAKPEGAAARMELRYLPQEAELTLSLGRQLAVHARQLGHDGQRMAVRFGTDRVSLPHAEGIWVDGSLPPVQVEPWLDLVGEIGKEAAQYQSAGKPDAFGGVSMALAEARFAGQKWSTVDLQVLRSGPSWLVNTRSDELQGQMLVSSQEDGGLAIAGQFERLSWSLGRDQAHRDVAVNSSASSGLRLPESLPSLDIRASRFVVDGEELGPLSLAVTANPAGYRIDALKIGPDARPALEITGEVEQASAVGSPAPEVAGDGVPVPEFVQAAALEQKPQVLNRLEFTLRDDDAMPWLRVFGYDRQLRAAAVDFSGAINWRTPEDLELLRVNGDVQFHFEDGRLLTVEPGAGRLLGLLSVTALPRRFLLDFSDVTDTGLSFDTLEGSYLISKGVAHTDNLKITTPSVRIEATGDVDLVSHTQDQVVRILPGISHGFTAAATVLGGPAVGLFMLFAQELLNKPLDQVGQIGYRISGPLDNPQVAPVQ